MSLETALVDKLKQYLDRLPFKQREFKMFTSYRNTLFVSIKTPGYLLQSNYEGNS